MRYLLSLALLFLKLQLSLAQDSSHVAKFDYNGNEFHPGTNKRISSRDNYLSAFVIQHLLDSFKYMKGSVCSSGVAMLKFTLSKKLGVIDVGCSSATPQILTNQFKTALLKSSKYWHIPHESKLIYVLPIYYSHPFDCEKGQVREEVSKIEDVFVFDDGTQLVDEACWILRPVPLSDWSTL
jgi:hypothetical protein